VAPDPAAFELAVDDLHGHVLALDRPVDELVAAGRWLLAAWPPTASDTARGQLVADVARLGPAD
jgi:hypothetical protein